MNSSSEVQSIFLAASSPLFAYSPFLSGSVASDGSWSSANTSIETPNQTAQSGNAGTPYRTVGRTNGSTVSLTGVSATGFTPFFTRSNGSGSQTASLQVGKSPEAILPASGSRIDLAVTSGNGTVSPFGPRDVKLKIACTGICDPNETFTFGGALIETLLVAPGSTAVNATLDDSADQINYTGFEAGGARDGKLLPDQLVSQSRDRTLSYTATKDANATLMFTGTAIEVLGAVGPTLSCYTLIVDNQAVFKYNASAPVFVAQQTLGFITGLAQQEHSLFLRNDVEGLGLALDAFKVWGQGVACFGSGCATGATPSSPPPEATPTQTIRTTVTPAANGPGYIAGGGTSAGSVTGGLIGALLGLILLFALWRYWMVKRKPKEEKPQLDAHDKANSLAERPNHFVSVKPKDEEGMGYMYPGRTAGTPFS